MADAHGEQTSPSLLAQLRAPASHSRDAWDRFVNLYTPLLFLWARQLGADEQEAPDLVQEVFLVLSQEMPHFRHNPARRFRGWLWTILVNKWRDRARQRALQPLLLDQQTLKTAVQESSSDELAESEYRAYLYARALELMQKDLPAGEWRAWEGYIVQGRPAVEVAEELGLTVNQVYLAKSRILRRLRSELEGLLD
jgi:RNA polymerase sigma-70 factor (ECF subfamily)